MREGGKGTDKKRGRKKSVWNRNEDQKVKRKTKEERNAVEGKEERKERGKDGWMEGERKEEGQTRNE